MMEFNLVEMWLRKDPTRWIAGAFAGLFAGLGALVVGMIISTSAGFEIWFPVKLMATPLLGPSATEFGMQTGVILTGLISFEALCLFLGFVYAHFTGSNLMAALLPMGLVWGIFSWIFIWNLFMQSFQPIFAARIPSGAAFPVCITFGILLASVAFFDRSLRGKR
jgi:hypothetical protein